MANKIKKYDSLRNIIYNFPGRVKGTTTTKTKCNDGTC